jgi:hypothetical protein
MRVVAVAGVLWTVLWTAGTPVVERIYYAVVVLDIYLRVLASEVWAWLRDTATGGFDG